MKQRIQCRVYGRTAFFSVFFLYALCALYAQNEKPALYFYAAPSSAAASGDPAVIKMTQDLLYSQLTALNLFTLRDKRDTEYSADILKAHSVQDFLFYAEIREKDGEWFADMHLIEAANAKETVLKNSYEGYYKILMDAKNSLTALIKRFNSGEAADIPAAAPESAVSGNIGQEALSGTWSGEQHIDKIVLLRGGRGFVIFKNGASMNITVSISGNTLTAVQQSKPDASFFPEIPREAALLNAPDAAPVRWELIIENESLMRGIKTSLTAEYDAAGSMSVKQGSIPVEWRR